MNYVYRSLSPCYTCHTLWWVADLDVWCRFRLPHTPHEPQRSPQADIRFQIPRTTTTFPGGETGPTFWLAFALPQTDYPAGMPHGQLP